MVYASLIVPENVPRKFLNIAFDAGLIDIVYPTENYALFDRSKSCACGSRDNLTIDGRTVVVKKNHHQASAFPFYALPEDCTFEETYVIVTWLVRNALKSFHSEIDGGNFVRSLKTNFWFDSKDDEKGCCGRFTLTKDPVFCMSKIVVSPFGMGPVLEKCIQNKADE